MEAIKTILFIKHRIIKGEFKKPTELVKIAKDYWGPHGGLQALVYRQDYSYLYALIFYTKTGKQHYLYFNETWGHGFNGSYRKALNYKEFWLALNLGNWKIL